MANRFSIVGKNYNKQSAMKGGLCFLIWSCLLYAAGCAGSPYADYNHALQLAQTGNKIQAEKEWRRVVEVNPENAEAWNQMGILAFERGDFPAAEYRFRQAYERNSTHPVYSRNLAYVYAEQQQFALAESLLRRSLEIEPANSKTLIALAKVELLQGHKPEACKTLQQALSLDPADLEAHDLLARLGENPD